MALSALTKTPTDTNLDTALAEARAHYTDLRPASLQAFETAQAYMPGGNTRTVLFHSPFPLRIVSGDGCHVTDADGFTYVNMLGEYTAGLFGHNNPVIRKAIDKALDNGINLSGHNPNEITLARLVCERFPAIDQVRFTNSGTEANLMAISTARYATRKNQVMVFKGGYHGGLLYFGNGGIPINAPFDYVLANYNDIDGTRQLIHEHRESLACVLVEPLQGSAGCIPGTIEFLSMLRDSCTKNGVMLIFDEVMTSRLSVGGAQALNNSSPDLTSLGKYIGGGMSFGAFGGRQDLMQIYDPRIADAIPHAGTFNNNSLSMAAGAAAMGEVLTKEKLTTLNQLGDKLRQRLNTVAQSHHAPIQFIGVGSLIGMHTTTTTITCVDDLGESDDRIMELLFLDLLASGYYIARRGFIALMLTLSNEDAEGFVSAFDRILENRREVLEKV